MANELIERLAAAPVVYREQRVITLRMMDELHELREGTAGRNFRENKRRLAESVDYYEVPHAEWLLIPLDDFRRADQAGQRNSLILLTESGYLLLVKSFRDDLAWEVQRALVNVYFRSKQLSKPTGFLTPDSFAACVNACKDVLLLGGMEDRDRVLLKDFARDGILIVTGKQLQPPGAIALVISNRCVELGFGRTTREDDKKIGKLIAGRYRAKHGKEPEKRSQHVDGAVRPVNHYTMEDLDVVDAGIRDYFRSADQT